MTDHVNSDNETLVRKLILYRKTRFCCLFIILFPFNKVRKREIGGFFLKIFFFSGENSNILILFSILINFAKFQSLAVTGLTFFLSITW